MVFGWLWELKKDLGDIGAGKVDFLNLKLEFDCS
jgi:hypothetical protein